MTPLEKLKAMAAAKKEKAADQPEVTKDGNVSSDSNSCGSSPNVQGSNPTKANSDDSSNEYSNSVQAGVTKDENVSREPTQSTEVKQELPKEETQQGLEVCANEDKLLEPGDKEDREGSLDVDTTPDPGSISRLEDDHPLKMQLAELEQALTEKLPEFRTILRDIHAKLRQDPDCVTAMSEDEIATIIQGLIHHANVDVIAPRAVKAAKKASKTPVSASDL